MGFCLHLFGARSDADDEPDEFAECGFYKVPASVYEILRVPNELARNAG